MKRNSILSILFLGFLLLSLSGCKKEEDPIMDDPDERLSEYLSEAQSMLTKAEYGYKSTLITGLEDHYFLFMKFGDDGRVNMLSDLNDESSTSVQSSSYRLKALQRPSILFDTYNYISMFADPQGSVNGGKNGEGLKGDNDFSFVAVNPDTITLVGNKNLSALILVPATKEEHDAYMEGQILVSRNNLKNFVQKVRFTYLKEGDKQISITINPDSRKVVLSRLEADGTTISSESSPFEYHEWGLKLGKELDLDGQMMDKLYWDSEKESYYLIVNEERRYVEDNPNPIFPLHLEFGDKKTYTIIATKTNELPNGVNSTFNSVWESVNNKFVSSGRNIRSMEFKLISNDKATFAVNYSSGSSNYVADISMDYTIENDIITFSKAKRDYSNGNWTTRIAQLQELEDFIWNKKFRLDWVQSTNPEITGLGGLYSLDDPNLFLYGFLD